MADHVRLMTELKSWQKRNPKKIICLGENVTEDGRLMLKLSIKDTKFHLLCPSNYPEHEDSFFMETECRDFWCVALNEFIIDSPEKLTLDQILAKTFLYYTPPCKRPGEELSSDNESDNEFNNSSEDSEAEINNEWEFLISKKKREWREKEGELRLRYNRPKISDMFDGYVILHPLQVFSNSASSAILINDLIKIMGNMRTNGIVVDTVENDVHRWSVFLKDFDPLTQIYKDLEEAQELYGYNNIQLQIDFAMDLYPWHPPSMTIIRPKLLNVFQSEDLVEFDNWNPVKDMMCVLKEVKDYINRNARINFQSTYNGVNVNNVKKILLELDNVLENDRKSVLKMDTASYSVGESAAQGLGEAKSFEKPFTGTDFSSSFSSGAERNTAIEIMLTKFLSCLTEHEKEPRESETHFTFNLALNNNVFEERNYEVRFSEGSNYLPSTFEAMKRLMENKKLKIHSRNLSQRGVEPQSDKKHCNIITNPSFGLAYLKSRDYSGLKNEKYSVNNVAIIAASAYGAKAMKNKFNGSKQRNETNVEHGVVSSFNANFKTRQEFSTTVPNNSFLESNANFSCVYKTLEESRLLPFIHSRLTVDTFFGIWPAASLFSIIIQILFELASNPYFINLLAKSDAQGSSIADLVKIQGENVTYILQKLADLTDECNLTQADLDKTELARRIIEVSKLIESKLPKNCDENLSLKLFSAFNNRDESPDSVYKESMKDLEFSNCDIDIETHALKHNYIAEIDSPRNYFRIAQELAFLSKSLPVELNSNIFVRTDNSKPFIMRTLIIGTEGTLGGGGCFSFDIYLKKDFPNDGVEIRSTTFWDGEKTAKHLEDRISLSCEEDTSSDPKSTILQILTSISNTSEKLIPPELFWDNRRDSERPELNETLLSKIIQFAMIDKIRRPTPGFEKVIATHFRLKKDRILSELERNDFLTDSELLDSLKKEFQRLK